MDDSTRQRIIALYQQGLSYLDVATALDLDQARIGQVIRAAGLARTKTGGNQHTRKTNLVARVGLGAAR